MSLKYHFQHIKNKTLKNVVFFIFHGTQNETIIFKNQTITIKEQRLCAGLKRIIHGWFSGRLDMSFFHSSCELLYTINLQTKNRQCLPMPSTLYGICVQDWLCPQYLRFATVQWLPPLNVQRHQKTLWNWMELEVFWIVQYFAVDVKKCTHACFIVFYILATGVLMNSMKLAGLVNWSQLKSSSQTAWSQQETSSEHLLSSCPGSWFLIDLH